MKFNWIHDGDDHGDVYKADELSGVVIATTTADFARLPHTCARVCGKASSFATIFMSP